MPRELMPCGTRAAYQRHWRRGEEPCDDCRAANSAQQRERNQATGSARARQRALGRLARMFPAEFSALLAEEKAEEKGLRQ